MTDYSVWIYAMLAVGALITAAVGEEHTYVEKEARDKIYLIRM